MQGLQKSLLWAIEATLGTLVGQSSPPLSWPLPVGPNPSRTKSFSRALPYGRGSEQREGVREAFGHQGR